MHGLRSALPRLMLIALMPLPFQVSTLLLMYVGAGYYSQLAGLASIAALSIYIYLSSVYSVSATICMIEEGVAAQCIRGCIYNTAETLIYTTFSVIILYSAGLIAAKEMHTAGFLAVYWALAIYAAATAREALKAHPPGVGLFFNAAGLAFAWLVTQFAAVPLLLALFGLVGGPACVASLHVPPPPQGLGSCRFFDGFSVCIDLLGYIGRFAALVAAYIHWSWLIGDNSTGG